MSAQEILSVQKTAPRWLEKILQSEWVSARIVVRGKLYRLIELTGLLAFSGWESCGVLTSAIEEYECELISLNSVREGLGSAHL
jgi:hypothetical protein